MKRSPGSALLLTIMLIVLLSLQVAILSMVAVRGLGDEAMMSSQNMSARRAAETAINALQDKLYTDLLTMTPDQAVAANNSTALNTMSVADPDNVYNTSTTSTAAWVSERRGDMYHLVGRGVVGSVDLLVNKWVRVKPCNPKGQLFTLGTGQQYPGFDAVYAGPDGRVMWGEDTAGSNNFYTWAEATGISTLITGVPLPGDSSIKADSTSRYYFGDGSPKFYTWKNGVMSVLMSGTDGSDTSTVDVSLNRVFFTNSGKVYLWSETSGLSTIVTGLSSPGDHSMALDKLGRLYFAESQSTNGKVFTWSIAGGLSTIAAGLNLYRPAYYSMRPSDDGRVYFGEYTTTNSRFLTWNSANNQLSILRSGEISAGYKNTGVLPNGRVFFSPDSNTGNLYTWKEPTGLSILATSNNFSTHTWDKNMLAGPQVSPIGRIFIAATSGPLWTWEESDGLSTITSSLSSLEPDRLATATDGRAFFGQGGSVSATKGMWTWKKGAGLSLLMNNVTDSGDDCIYPDPYGGGVFFCEDLQSTAAARFMVWSPAKGLSIIGSNFNEPGDYSSYPNPLGGIFFGSSNPSTNMYYWRWSDCRVN